jgi:glycosyltransferase involved in cell wall biosynthesis
MQNIKPLVLFINNIAPLYRKNVWTKYLESEKIELHFFYGKENHSGIKTIEFDKGDLKKFKNRVHIIKNFYISRKYLVWQNFKIFKWLKLKPKAIILLGEFNVVSNWILTVLAKICGIEVIHKGHGMYGNEKGLKLIARRAFLKLADKHLVYERHGKNILKSNGIHEDKVHIQFNSLDYDEHLKLRTVIEKFNKSKTLHFFENPVFPTLIFIGRLTKAKKLDLIIAAAQKLQNKNIDVNILFVGDGIEEQNLKKLAAEQLLDGSFHFYGASYDEKINSKLIAVADLCVSPGNVGLTAIHSLSYGTPVCTHSNLLFQMPEAEAIEHGINGILFEKDNIDSLTEVIKTWLSHNNNRKLVREKCYEIIDKYYNPYYQTKVIENLIEGNKPLI